MSIVQQKLLVSPAVTDKILRSMQEGLIAFNSEDHIQFINIAALKIFGFTSDKEIVGKHVRCLFENSEVAFNFLILLEKEKQLSHQEIVFRKVTGEGIVCLLSASVIQDAIEGDLLKVITLQNITERKQAEQQLQEYSVKLEKNNKELDQFSYIVSHDLKAPLRAIINLSQWLYEDLEKDISEDSKKNLEMLRGRVLRMEALINGILEYSKIGRSTLPSERVDVAELLNEIVDLLVPPKHIVVKIDACMPVVTAPKIMLLQVFSNLISNAIKYNDKSQGLVHIQVQQEADTYKFIIEDNGPGIPKEYQEKVFVIFQTLQSRDKVESTGIGLTIVKRIIEEQGGKVWIESEEGKGSKFIFLWPKNSTNQ